MFEEKTSKAFRFHHKVDGKEVGRLYLYILENDLHDKPYGFLEDLYVDETARGQGIGSSLVKQALEKAREVGCYKVLGTSRHAREDVHAWYQRLGFYDRGKEFRIDL